MNTKTDTAQLISVSTEEAARVTGLTRSTVYIAIAKGELKSFKCGRRRLILIKELEAWINNIAKNGER